MKNDLMRISAFDVSPQEKINYSSESSPKSLQNVMVTDTKKFPQNGKTNKIMGNYDTFNEE